MMLAIVSISRVVGTSQRCKQRRLATNSEWLFHFVVRDVSVSGD